MITDGKVVRCESLAIIRLSLNETIEVRCIGYFKMYRWWFLITEDVEWNGYYALTEASTGCTITSDYCYEDIEELLRIGMSIIETKRYYFSTATLELLVKTQQNLIDRNLSTVQANILMI